MLRHGMSMADKNLPKRKVDEAHNPRTLYLVKQVQYKTWVRLEDALNPTGITTAQFRILFTLGDGKKRSSADLSRMFGVKPQTMIKQIALLEGRGLIERAAAAANKRVLEVKLTKAGTIVLEKANSLAVLLEDDIFSVLSPNELQQFRESMMKILSSLPRTDHEVAEYQLTPDVLNQPS